MKTRPSLVGLLLMTLAVSTPSRADLFIERLLVSAKVTATTTSNGVPVHVSNSPDFHSNFDTHGTPDGPFDLPSVLTAKVTTPSQLGLSLQTKGGFFRDFARFSRGFSGGGTKHTVDARSTFLLVVGATTSDSPLVLDFDFLGANVYGSAHYGDGSAIVNVEQSITGYHGLPRLLLPDPDWAFYHSVVLQSGSWIHDQDEDDPHGIGMPAAFLTTNHYNTGFSTALQLDLTNFHGRLDFGTLQPGEFFTLEYDATARVSGTLGYGGTMQAELIDPFTLGGPPQPQLSLQGLTLPPTPVPEPRLNISLVDLEHARITWPTNAAGYALQFTPSLPALTWTTITDTPAVIGDRFALIVDTTDGSRFYRLR